MCPCADCKIKNKFERKVLHWGQAFVLVFFKCAEYSGPAENCRTFTCSSHVELNTTCELACQPLLWMRLKTWTCSSVTLSVRKCFLMFRDNLLCSSLCLLLLVLVLGTTEESLASSDTMEHLWYCSGHTTLEKLFSY